MPAQDHTAVPPREPDCLNPAPGGPGIEPRWTRSSKDAVGTARSPAGHLWFTLSSGVINEVYYPTIDRPQLRDLQFLVTDGRSFFHDERRDLHSVTECLSPTALGFRVTEQTKPVLFTFYYPADDRWEGRDYAVRAI